MALIAGTRLGPYEVQAPLGAGGMGEVYKGIDTRLDRAVAIKILPADLADDPQFRERFEREAKTISQLTHPHICTLYDVGDAVVSLPSSVTSPQPPVTSHQPLETIRFLVLEYLEGGTLADRLQKGPLPLDDVLRIAIEIGDALDKAHRAGVVHRDLKPGNIMLTASGAKLLDFGLAKSRPALTPSTSRAVPGASNLTASPTMTTPPPNVTAQGTILGTFQYMSPEQLEGEGSDARSDIFAFGAVLYEMVTGRKAFQGKTQVSMIGAILKDQPPPMATAQTAVPDAVEWVVRKCLAKDPDRRWQTACDLVSQLEWIAEGGAAPMTAPTDPRAPRASRLRRSLALAGAVLLAAAAGIAAWMLKPSPAAKSPSRFSFTPQSAGGVVVGSPFRDLAISPGGTHIAYVEGTTPSNTQLMVRAIDQLEGVPLRGTTGGVAPFFSPDGRWIAYFAEQELRKIAVTGGPPISLCKVPAPSRGGTWGPDDTIVFASANAQTGLFSVPAGGGEPKVLTTPDNKGGELDHVFPFFLPGGRHVLFTIQGATNTEAQVAVLELKTGQRKTLVRGGGQAEYVRTGHLIYAAAGTLRAVRFDLERLQVLSDPVPVIDQVMTKTSGAAEFSVSGDGSLVYAPGSVVSSTVGPPRTLMWVDRKGHEEPIEGAPMRTYMYPRLSPDGTRIALDIRDQENDIWTWDLNRRTLTRLTFDPATDGYPVWTPDSKRIIFYSTRAGAANLYWQAADGTGAIERLTTATTAQAPYSLTPDGKRLILRESATQASGAFSLHSLRLDTAGAGGSLKSEPVIHTTFSQDNGELSADGRWIAYQSNESGKDQVYVRPFPKVDEGRWQISTSGGSRPLWARSGRELFFLDENGVLMSVPVQTSAAFSAGNPTKLLDARYYQSTGRSYDVTRDGSRFLMIKPSPIDPGTSRQVAVVVVLNWSEELKARVPAK